MKIAGNLTVKDWEDLSKKLDVDNDDLWGNAFNFFEERIKTRYLNPINQILQMDLKTGEGFAVVNLQCSLIETIECFLYGWIYKHPNYFCIKDKSTFRGNQQIFESFFDNRSPFKELKIEGCDFYKNVRCALLHETQTKKGWVVKKGNKKIYDTKIIYREAFQAGIEKVLEDYKDIIINKKDKDIRNYLKIKFDHICKES
jgi:hypothetical protein